MANLLQTLFGGESPNTSGQPAGGGAYSGAPMPQSAPQTSGSNPFARAFASDAGGLPGLIGQLTGAPTTGEMAQQRMGNMQAAGLQGFEQRLQQGMPMQQALVDFMGSPEGHQFFGSSQDPMGTLRAYLSTAHPVAQYDTVGQSTYNKLTGEIKQNAPVSLSPGEKRIDGNGNPIASNDTTDMQTFNDTAKAANWSPAETQDAARLLFNSKITTDATAKANAIGQLVQRGLVSQDWAQKYQAGMIQVQPTYDAAHSPNGMAIVDLSKMALTGNPADAHVVIAGSQNGGPAGDMAAGTTATPEGQPKGPSGDIIFGAGVVGNAAHTFGDIAGNINSNLAAPVYNQYKASIEAIKAKVNDIASGSSRLAQSAKIYQDLVDKDGWASNPIDQGTAFLSLHDFIDRNLAYDNAVLASTDRNYTNEVKQKFAQERADLLSLQANMPAREALLASMAKAEQGQGTIGQGLQEAGKHVGEAAKSVTDTVNQAITSGSQAVDTVTGTPPTAAPATEAPKGPATFQSLPEAEAAAKAGTLKPGDRMILNGVPGTWK